MMCDLVELSQPKDPLQAIPFYAMPQNGTAPEIRHLVCLITRVDRTFAELLTD